MESYWDKVRYQRLQRRRLLKAGGALSLGAASLALVGCGDDDDGGNGGATATPGGGSTPGAGASPTQAGSGQPKPGGRFASQYSNEANWNPISNYNGGYRTQGVHAYDRLITARLTQQGYVLEAADSVELQDPLTVVFKFKPGQVYQDRPPVNGRPVRAADLVAVNEYVKNLPNAENSGFQRRFLDFAEAPDDTTIVFHMQSPNAYMFASTQLCNPTGQLIIPEEMLDQLDTAEPVGSGPYQFREGTFSVRYLYDRNPTFRGASEGLPYVDEREIFALTDPVAIETSLRGGQLSEWRNVPSTIIDRLRNEVDPAKLTLLETPSVFIEGINVNMDPEFGVKPWHDVRVREAIYRVTNREQFLDLVFNGHGVIPSGPLFASLEAYQLEASETEDFYRNDLDEAKKLMDAAAVDTSRDYEVIVYNTTPLQAQAAEVWQQQLSQIGLNIRVTVLPFAEWLPNRIAPGEFDLIVCRQPGGDTPYRAMRNNHSTTNDQFSHVGLYDPEIDAMIEESEQAVDREENIRLVKEIQRQILQRYSLSYVTVTPQEYGFVDARVRNYEYDPITGQDYQTDIWFDV